MEQFCRTTNVFLKESYNNDTDMFNMKLVESVDQCHFCRESILTIRQYGKVLKVKRTWYSNHWTIWFGSVS